MKTTTFGILVCWLASIGLSHGQALWRGTSVGMTEEQVKAILPQVVKPENPSKLAGFATETLRLDGVEVAKIPFEASFYFKEGSLRQVSLSVKDPRGFKDSLERFTVLRNHLREQFGQERSTKSRRGIIDLEEAVWVRGERQVVLFLLGVLTDPALLIHYQAEPGWQTVDGQVVLAPVPKQNSEAENKRYLAAKAKAEQGDADAQLNMAVRLSTGLGVEANRTQATQWFRRAADQNHIKAQAMLGGCYAQGIGVAKDSREAVKWFRRAAEQSDALAQNALGFSYASGQGVLRDDKVAIEWYRKAADQGYDQAQYNMGYSYENGLGIARNDAEAVIWYRQAAEQKYVDAQFNLGSCYLAGRGLAKNEVESYKWMLLAGARGHAVARQNLTLLERQLTRQQLAEGQKRAGDFNLPEVPSLDAQQGKTGGNSLADLRAKAATGDAKAQNELGEAFYAGKRGVTKNAVAAVKWFRQAADQNHPAAQSNLGVCYELGDGVPKYEVEAYKWDLLAAVQGDTKAKRNASMLELMLSPQEITEGKRRADDWLEQRKTTAVRTQ